MAVDLWNDRTANLIDAFSSEADALTAVREVIEREGSDAVSDWALDLYDGSPMIRGRELVDRALKASLLR